MSSAALVVLLAASFLIAFAGLLSVFKALSIRQRRLEHMDIVNIGGHPFVVVAVTRESDESLGAVGFEALDEYLARTVRLGRESQTLAQVFLKAGWRPPKSPVPLAPEGES